MVVSFIIDRYTSDVLERLLKRRNIPFLGMTASIAPNYVMMMDRGRLIRLRAPSRDEVEQAKKQIINESFAPSYVNASKKYTRSLYWKIFCTLSYVVLYFAGCAF